MVYHQVHTIDCDIASIWLVTYLKLHSIVTSLAQKN